MRGSNAVFARTPLQVVRPFVFFIIADTNSIVVALIPGFRAMCTVQCVGGIFATMKRKEKFVINIWVQGRWLVEPESQKETFK
jgi:hypothetical protein